MYKSSLAVAGVLVACGLGYWLYAGRYSPANVVLPQDALDSYLADRSSVRPSEPGGRVFCSSDVVGAQKSGSEAREYLWAYCQEYYPSASGLAHGTGGSFPAVVTARRIGGVYVNTGYAEGSDGNFDTPDNHRLLPGVTFRRIRAHQAVPPTVSPIVQAQAYFSQR